MLRQRQRPAAEVQQQAIEDLLTVCQSEAGRRVVWTIITETGLWDRIKAPNPDIHFLEGRRDVGAWLQDWLNAADPNLVPLMMQETVNANLLTPVKVPREESDEPEDPS